MHRDHHGPEPAAQSIAGDDHPTQDSARGERNDADRPVDDPHLFGRKPQAPRGARIQQKWLDELQRLRLREAEQHQESQYRADSFPAEERCEARRESAYQRLVLDGVVDRGRRQRESVPSAEHQEQRSRDDEHDRPRQRHVAREIAERAREIDEAALARDHPHAEEGAPHADEGRLLVLLERQHVEAVGGDVVGRRGEGEQPQDRERHLEEMRHRQRERHQRQRGADRELHREDPDALGREHVDERRPDRLHDPRQVEPARVQRDVGVGDAERLVHDDRHRHHHHERDRLGEVEGGNPAPGAHGPLQYRA